MPRIRPLVIAVTALYVAELLAIAAMPIILRPRSEPLDLAVVFGNAVTEDGEPSPRLKARLDVALAVYKAGRARRILVSGGVEPGPSSHSEPAAMADYLTRRGVPSSALIQDPAGRNTAATAADTEQFVAGSERVLLVTQWFHVARAALAMRQHGIRAVSASCPAYAEWRDLYSLLRESIALPAYLFRPR